MIVALLDPTALPYERIKAAKFALAFAEGWHADLHKKHKEAMKEKKKCIHTDTDTPRSVATQFITSNAAKGLRLNVNGLIAYTYALAASPTLRQLPYAPFLLNSQEAEHRFRIFRSLCGHENFTYAEFLRRSNQQEAHTILKAKHANKDFFYKPSAKAWNFDEMPHMAPPLPADFTVTTLFSAAEAGCEEARLLLHSCGIVVAKAECVAMDMDEELMVEVDDELHNIEWEQGTVRFHLSHCCGVAT